MFLLTHSLVHDLFWGCHGVLFTHEIMDWEGRTSAWRRFRGMPQSARELSKTLTNILMIKQKDVMEFLVPQIGRRGNTIRWYVTNYHA